MGAACYWCDVHIAEVHGEALLACVRTVWGFLTIGLYSLGGPYLEIMATIMR